MHLEGGRETGAGVIQHPVNNNKKLGRVQKPHQPRTPPLAPTPRNAGDRTPTTAAKGAPVEL